MREHTLAGFLPLLLAPALAACVAAPPPGAGGRAGLVVVHAGGALQTACVRFEGPDLSGYDLLRAAGFDLAVDAANPMGVMVCSLDGEGCAFPAQPCLCECSAPGACTYWAYFARTPEGGWAYSPLGPSARRLADGAVDGWVWLTSAGAGAPTEVPLPDLDFEEVCPDGAP